MIHKNLPVPMCMCVCETDLSFRFVNINEYMAFPVGLQKALQI